VAAGDRRTGLQWSANLVAVLVVLVVLAGRGSRSAPSRGVVGNALFIGVIVGGVLLLAFWLVLSAFPIVLAWALRTRSSRCRPALLIVLLGATVWLGFDRVFGWLPESVRRTPRWSRSPTLFRAWQRVHAIARRGRVPLHAHHHAARVDR
jgi:copper/silver efflux system protein